ncbi:hypothetical protein [Salinifilum ghardaiensis]
MTDWRDVAGSPANTTAVPHPKNNIVRGAFNAWWAVACCPLVERAAHTD